MLKNKTIGVIVPAYNEELLIGKTLSSMPDFVDTIITINDCSRDRTKEVICGLMEKDRRITLIDHAVNKGLGQSLIDGYLKSREMRIDITAVMAGDAQMDPNDLESVVMPILDDIADYAKGNRLLIQDVAEHMPFHRLIGNAGLTFLTKFATGYWHVIDPQCGYTAISRRALMAIPIERMTKRYGYNADILNMLNIQNFAVADVEVRPVYDKEKSKIKLYKYIPHISCLLTKLFIRRLKSKYIIRDFNPLCLSYLFGMFLLFFGTIPFAIRLIYMYYLTTEFPQTSLLCLMFITLIGLQVLLFAIQFDKEDNRPLCIMNYEHHRKNGIIGDEK